MWCHSELVVGGELGKPVYLVDLGPGLERHPLLRAVQGIGFGGSLEEGFQRLAGSLARDGLDAGAEHQYKVTLRREIAALHEAWRRSAQGELTTSNAR